MSSNTDTKPDHSSAQAASSEPKLATQETELATNPKGDESLEASKPDKPTTYTEMATNVAASATANATATAANLKDNVFSMFGGGTKKEKKEESEEAVNEPSGSSKAKKEAEEDDVRALLPRSHRLSRTIH